MVDSENQEVVELRPVYFCLEAMLLILIHFNQM